MSITPDTKDWTWVLERPCVECGFDASTLDHRDVAGYLRKNAAQWPEILAGPDARVRPRPDVWSPLEYGAHVRDVFRLFRQRFELMLAEDDPEFANWDQDKTAVEDRYSEQDPAVVADELTAAAEDLASLLDEIAEKADAVTVGSGRGPTLWDRSGLRGDGARFTVATFARYLAHDPAHHLFDVRK